MTVPQRLSSTSCFSTASYKYRFVQGFLRALKRINRRSKTASQLPSPREICRRFLKVKSAADASMASAVGLRRAWSRALIQKTRAQDQMMRNFGNKYYPVRRSSTSTAAYNTVKNNKNYILETGHDEKEQNNVGINWKANELRKLVPGGEEMDMCELLEETAHYIECLATQVKLMRRIADYASA